MRPTLDSPFPSSPCGSSLILSPSLLNRLASLRRAVGELVCIEYSDVIAFFGNGEQVRDDNVLQAGTDGWDEVRRLSYSLPATASHALLTLLWAS